MTQKKYIQPAWTSDDLPQQLYIWALPKLPFSDFNDFQFIQMPFDCQVCKNQSIQMMRWIMRAESDWKEMEAFEGKKGYTARWWGSKKWAPPYNLNLDKI